MSKNRRGLRSSSSASSDPVAPTLPLIPNLTENIRVIAPGSKLPGLSVAELKLLREKQRRLVANASSTVDALPGGTHIRNALEATLIFAQYEAGTAICIHRAGWILTCAHCFGDTEKEFQMSNKRKWLLFYTGLAVYVECRVWNGKRDLALLEVIAIESSHIKAGELPDFASIPVSEDKPTYKMPILCIGQPGRDDLEATSDKRTKYNLVEISEGVFRGMVQGADPQDNSEIGTLKHDSWTYWGHSGAPLLRESDGTLVGLHSSWDDKTAMRHGIPQIAIKEFLQQQELFLKDRSQVPVNAAKVEAESGTSDLPIIIE